MAAVGALASTAAGQTIRPVVAEFQARGQGRLELVNDSERPLNVVLQPRGFTVDERGELHDAPLSDGIRISLSTTSLRIPPKQSRLVFYDAVTARAPAWFVLYAMFTGYPRADYHGVDVQLELPHIVYLLPKTRWSSTDIHVASAAIDPGAKRLVIELENTGSHVGRITDIELRGSSGRTQAPGFAFFPGQRRRVEIPWDGDEVPDSLLLKSREFALERRLPLGGG